MNRIIIIGNGFDLAHNLKTRYKDFINDYWATAEEGVYDNTGGYWTNNMEEPNTLLMIMKISL